MKWTLLAIVALGLLLLSFALALQGRGASPDLPVTQGSTDRALPAPEHARSAPDLDAARRPVTSGTATIQLKQVSANDLLGAPAVRVVDEVLGEEHRLTAGWQVEVPAKPARTLRLESTSPGWMLSQSELELAGGELQEYALLAESGHMLIFSVLDATTGRPIEHLEYKVVWDDAVTGLRDESAERHADGPGGQYLLESVPIDEGRFRVELSAHGYFEAKTEWFEAEMGYAHVADLTLNAKAGGAGTIAVRVQDWGSGAHQEGIRVELLGESPDSPITAVMVGDHSLTPIYDDESLQSPGPRFGPEHTGPDGVAEFVVPAPGQYRIAVGGHGELFRLEDAVTIEVDGYLEHVVDFGQPASLRGSLVLADSFLPEDRETLQSAWLDGAGGILSTPLEGDGAFHFPSVVPGEYELFIDRMVTMPDGTAMLTRLVTRDVTLRSGEEADVTLDMRTVTRDGLVEGRLNSSLRGASGMGLVALTRSTDGTLAGVRGDAEHVAVPEPDGSFTFQGVDPGHWMAVAMEQSGDGREIGLLYDFVRVDEGGLQSGDLTLAPSGSVLTIAGDFQQDETAALLALRASGGADILSRLIGDLPNLVHTPGEESFVYGLPADDLLVVHAGLELPVGTEGTYFTPGAR